MENQPASVLADNGTQTGAPFNSMSRNLLSDFPELASELHRTLNPGIHPEDISMGSHRKLWWVCSRDSGHVWEAVVKNRTKANGSGCPYCSGRMVTPATSLAARFPDLTKEWDYEINPVRPDQVACGSNTKFFWVCIFDKSHKWSATPQSRTGTNKTGCPFCSGAAVQEATSLYALHPDLMEEWDWEANRDLDPKKLSKRSNIRARWQCKTNPKHKWVAVVGNRTGLNSGCPYCTGKKADSSNSLATIFPQLCREWATDLNKTLTPSDVTTGSRKSVWWRCPKGHEWKAAITSRTHGSGCPRCSNQSSKPEARLLAELQALFPEIKSRHKIGKIEVDAFIPDLKIGIEYDGSYYHRNKEAKDREKNRLLKSAGVQLIRVRHKPLQKIEDNDVLVDADDLSKPDLNSVVHSICQIAAAESVSGAIVSYIARDKFLNEELFREYISVFPSPLPQLSLNTLFPEISAEWDLDKNKPLMPLNFPPGSNHKTWWVCSKGHSYQSAIISRTGGHGCPFCAGNFRIDTQRAERSAWLAESNSALTVTHPRLAAEWHPTANNYTPDDVSAGSTYKVWWQCVQGHEWEATVYNRSKSSNPSGCPYCTNKRASSTNNLEIQNPALASEWNQARNEGQLPNWVVPGSGKLVWWVCANGHEWQAKVAARSKGTGCPDCYQEALANNAAGVLDSNVAIRIGPTKAVRCLETGEVFKSATAAAKSLQQRGIRVNASHISGVCRASRAKAGGFTWVYV